MATTQIPNDVAIAGNLNLVGTFGPAKARNGLLSI